jgi:hypothetical protein
MDTFGFDYIYEKEYFAPHVLGFIAFGHRLRVS